MVATRFACPVFCILITLTAFSACAHEGSDHLMIDGDDLKMAYETIQKVVVDGSFDLRGRRMMWKDNKDASQRSNEQVSHRGDVSQKEESERLAKEHDELIDLMRKDYRGKPRHRPPVNNHEPNN